MEGLGALVAAGESFDLAQNDNFFGEGDPAGVVDSLLWTG